LSKENCFIISFTLLQEVSTIPVTKESKEFDQCIVSIAPALFYENEKDIVQDNTGNRKTDLNAKP